MLYDIIPVVRKAFTYFIKKDNRVKFKCLNTKMRFRDVQDNTAGRELPRPAEMDTHGAEMPAVGGEVLSPLPQHGPPALPRGRVCRGLLPEPGLDWRAVVLHDGPGQAVGDL
jgi:hypothetical protein